MKKIIFLTCLLAPILWASVGKIVFIKGEVFVDRAGSYLDGRAGLALENSDTVITGKKGKVAIVFNDKGTISLGKNSELVVEKYLHDEANNQHEARLTINKGLFSAVSGRLGKLAPERFKLKTKTATMGIRGTMFSGIVDSASVVFYCRSGMISVEAEGQEELVRAGNKSSVVFGEPPSKPEEYKPEEIQEILQETNTIGVSEVCEVPEENSAQKEAE